LFRWLYNHPISKLIAMKTMLNYRTILMFFVLVILSASANSKNPASALKEETVSYVSDGVPLKGFVIYDESIKGKRPAIIIAPEWWGVNDYIRMRARKLAELGYIAMAADLFGNGKIAANPKEAQEFTMPFYKDPVLGKKRIDAAIRKIKEFSQTDPANIAAIGYCFGGFVVLNSAKLGSHLEGVVSFHGGLSGSPADKNLLKAKILVCHGASDKFVTQKDVDAFKHQMDSIGADYTFKIYANATHAFTNPDATKIGKEFNMPIEYNADADRDSWNDMKTFFGRLFKK
jgi:dienelactone hydrolase